jgi:hypothetical protein
MAIAHFNYAKQVPETVAGHIPERLSEGISAEVLSQPIGEQSVMHSHNTYPTHAQKYHSPMWELPQLNYLEEKDIPTITTNRKRYEKTKDAYLSFAQDVIARLNSLNRMEL